MLLFTQYSLPVCVAFPSVLPMWVLLFPQCCQCGCCYSLSVASVGVAIPSVFIASVSVAVLSVFIVSMSVAVLSVFIVDVNVAVFILLDVLV